MPLAEALFAGKVGSLALEHRIVGKRGSDGEDAVRLLEAFGSAALMDDLRFAVPAERTDLWRLLDAIRGSGLSAQARASGHDVDAARLENAVGHLLEGLSSPA